VSHQVSRPYKTTDNIIFLYISIFTCLVSKLGDKKLCICRLTKNTRFLDYEGLAINVYTGNELLFTVTETRKYHTGGGGGEQNADHLFLNLDIQVFLTKL
jgi:hypothetical protein